MLQRIGFDIHLAVSSPTMLVANLLVRPEFQRDLRALEHLSISPELVSEAYSDPFGNRAVRVAIPEGVDLVELSLDTVAYYSGEPDPVVPDAEQHPLHELPVEVLQFLLPSRYCEVDSELMDYAWQTFGSVPPGWARVQAVVDAVHERIRFDYANARPTRTALEAFREGTGVCRDFAHLAVTLCRCLNIPARYVNGYLGDIGIEPLPDPMDFSAWFHVYLGGRWYAFDARHNEPRIGRIEIAYGRDAADVAMTTVFGSHELRRFEVTTYELPDGEVPDGEPAPGGAGTSASAA